MKNIAVIGAGISGLAAAYLLSRRHRVHLFEQERRLGGPTHTVVVDTPDGAVPLDTGCLVHNDRTYPNLVRVFAELPGRGPPALEIGQAMTGPDGNCEILLAPQAR